MQVILLGGREGLSEKTVVADFFSPMILTYYAQLDARKVVMNAVLSDSLEIKDPWS